MISDEGSKSNLEIIEGNITDQPDIEAVVNAANSRLAPGGGVAGAIHKASGPKLYEEAKEKAPIKPGDCVITEAYDLPNKYVLHCLGPRYGIDEPAPDLLESVYKRALIIADNYNISSVAFPAISTGAFGYPIEEAAEVSLRAVLKEFKNLKNVNRVRFVLHSKKDRSIFERVYRQVRNL
ncbi:MAG: macro domain-containing protein [Patescibacteria group bacterium]